ncbi:uncharacterized protein G2W53_004126 [Senna tora]|uniref:Uncharacterized protein n=1 Tax=Senna tora TaxID=362788 RepID=A0A834XEL1_9FABA|nr:uncharacterized protein G2W53_004126 [Senna tora]
MEVVKPRGAINGGRRDGIQRIEWSNAAVQSLCFLRPTPLFNEHRTFLGAQS